MPKNSADHWKVVISRGFAVVVVEQSAEFIAAADAAHHGEARRRLDQFILDFLMIASPSIIVAEGRDGRVRRCPRPIASSDYRSRCASLASWPGKSNANYQDRCSSDERH